METLLYVLPKSNFFDRERAGAISHALGIIKGFVEHNWEVIVVSGPGLNDYVSQLDDSLQKNIVPIEIKTPSRGRLFSEISWLRAFGKKVKGLIQRRYEVDTFLVRYSISRGPLLASMASRVSSFGITTVLEVNSLAFHYTKALSPMNRILLKLESFLASRFDLVYVISDQLKKDLVTGGCGANLISIPNAADPREEKLDSGFDKSGSEPRFVYFGSFYDYYDFTTVIDAFEGLNYNSNIELHFYGYGPELSRVKKYAEGMKGVNFHGRYQYQELGDIVQANDILLLPYWDSRVNNFGSPIKLYEYLSFGLPIIGSNVGQIGQIIENEKTGYLYNSSDPEELRSVMRRVLKYPQEREQCGERALGEFLENHTWERRMHDLIKNLKK